VISWSGQWRWCSIHSRTQPFPHAVNQAFAKKPLQYRSHDALGKIMRYVSLRSCIDELILNSSTMAACRIWLCQFFLFQSQNVCHLMCHHWGVHLPLISNWPTASFAPFRQPSCLNGWHKSFCIWVWWILLPHLGEGDKNHRAYQQIEKFTILKAHLALDHKFHNLPTA